MQLLEETAKHINDYALIGLRTLAVAKRDLTEEEYHRHALLCFSALKPKLWSLIIDEVVHITTKLKLHCIGVQHGLM